MPKKYKNWFYIQEYRPHNQILTNDAEVGIPLLSSILLAVKTQKPINV